MNSRTNRRIASTLMMLVAAGASAVVLMQVTLHSDTEKAIYSTSIQLQRAKLEITHRQDKLDEQIFNIETKQQKLTAMLAEQAALSKISTATELSAVVAKRLTKLASDTKEVLLNQTAESLENATLGKRLRALELVILADPVKAVSIPLLRKDLRTLTQRLDAAATAAREDSGRLNTIVLAIGGMIVTIALTLVPILRGFNKGEADPAARD